MSIPIMFNFIFYHYVRTYALLIILRFILLRNMKEFSCNISSNVYFPDIRRFSLLKNNKWGIRKYFLPLAKHVNLIKNRSFRISGTLQISSLPT